MENQLYKPSYSTHLPVLEEPDQQVVWSKRVFSKDTILLYLQDFDLKEESLKTAVAAAPRPSGSVAATMSTRSAMACVRARKEFEKTGKIEGFLFLAPDLQKVWLSHYDVGYLFKVS